MIRPSGCSRWAVLAAMGVILTGCASRPAAATGSDAAKADEAAIRRTLAEVERRINQNDSGFVDVFAQDAAIIAPGAPDIAGYSAIAKMYGDLMKQVSMEVHFSTEEVAVAGDLAYEHGTYTLRMTDRATNKVVQDVKNKHVHILKRQPDGSWKTWRMMVSSAEPAAPQH